MTDTPTRDEMEARLARVVAKTNREVLNLIMDLLGEPPDISKLTPEVWMQIQAAYEQALTAEYEKVFLIGAAIVLALFTVGVDYAVMNERATQYAREYVHQLVNDLNTKNQQQVTGAVTDFLAGRLDQAGYEARLGRLFGAVRADTISITEITRILTAGGKGVVEELRSQGLRIRGRIRISKDDRVCTICLPKNMQDVDVAGMPPYHTRCRCNVEYYLEKIPT